MNNLIEKFKQLITSSHKLHTLIIDYDNLLEYEEIQGTINEMGYRIIKAETEIDIRIIFENEIRESKNKYLIIAPNNYKPLPDIDIFVNFITLKLKDLFPNLDNVILNGLSFRNLSVLYNIRIYEDLGQEQTIKFVLENIYNVNFDTLTRVKAKERILNALIVVYLGRNSVNISIAQYLTNLARQYFPSLTNTLLNKNDIIRYLNDIWTEYINFKKSEIDFEDAILNKNICYLFLYEIIKPIKITNERLKSIPNSLKVGVYTDRNENNDNELKSLNQYLEEKILTIEDSYEDWFTLIQILAKMKLKQLQSKNNILINNSDNTELKTNGRFQQFIENTYWSLFSLSGVKKPVVVTRILEYIKAQPFKRKALVVIDGMNYWQSLIIESELKSKGIKTNLKTTLSYIPSITAWSRQAIFKGSKPDLNEDNMKEEYYFYEFWQNHGYTKSQVEFLKIGTSKDNLLKSIKDTTEILGVVCNDLDTIMHGMTLGNRELKTSTEHWMTESKFSEDIKYLTENGFKIYLTTDHGNICAKGIKNLKINDKIGSPSRSKRHLLFSNITMLSNFIQQNKDLNIGIKDLSIYLRNNDAFTQEGTNIITHGGSHFWEVLIPFLEIE